MKGRDCEGRRKGQGVKSGSRRGAPGFLTDGAASDDAVRDAERVAAGGAVLLRARPGDRAEA